MLRPDKFISLLCLTFLLASCASAPIKLYPGDKLPSSQIATLSIPVELEILTLNDQEVPSANRLLGTSDRQLQLQPGNYQLLLFYKNIWQTSADSHETIRSNPVTFDLSLNAGQTYQVDFERPKNAHQAYAIRDDFHAWVIDSNGQKADSKSSGLIMDDSFIGQLTGRVKTIKAEEQTRSQQQVIAPLTATASAPETGNIADAPVATQQAAAMSYLDMLKAQWNQASADEKRAFLQWISQPAP